MQKPFGKENSNNAPRTTQSSVQFRGFSLFVSHVEAARQQTLTESTNLQQRLQELRERRKGIEEHDRNLGNKIKP